MGRRSVAHVRSWRRILAAVVAGGAGAVFLGGPGQAAPPPQATFTWSGGAAVSGDSDWSNPGNWAGGVAPAPGQTVDLVFPALVCVSESTCEEAVNDVTGLTVASMAIHHRGVDDVFVDPHSTYYVHGNRIRMSGPLTLDLDTTAGDDEIGATTLDLPIRLTTAGTWSVTTTTLTFVNDMTGSRLTVNRFDRGSLNVHNLPDAINVAKFIVRSAGFPAGSRTGAVNLLFSSVNASNGKLVKVKHTNFFADSANLGQLVAKNVFMQPGEFMNVHSAVFENADMYPEECMWFHCRIPTGYVCFPGRRE